MREVESDTGGSSNARQQEVFSLRSSSLNSSRFKTSETRNNIVEEGETSNFEIDDPQELTKMEETTGRETEIGPEDGAPSTSSFSSFSSEDYDNEEEEQESSFQESTMAARRKELEAQATAEILAVQEFKLTLSEELSHMEARRQELAAEATAEIKAARDVKHATLAKFMSGEEEEEDEDENEGGEYEDEEGSYNLLAGGRVPGTHGDDYTSEGIEAAAVGGEDLLTTDNAVERDELMSSVSEEEGNDYVEKLQAINANTFGSNTRTIVDMTSIKRPSQENPMRNLSVGTAYTFSFVKSELLDFNDEEISFEEEDIDYDIYQRENDHAEINVDMEIDCYNKENDVSTSITKGKNEADILTDWPNRFNIELSEVQMIQSLKLALEADKCGLREFRTVEHLHELETVPIYSFHNGKPSLSKQHRLGSRIRGMMRRAKSKIPSMK